MEMRFAENMVIVRTVRGWSEAKLAAASGLTRCQIANIANHRKEPRLAEVVAISNALGVPATALEPALSGVA